MKKLFLILSLLMGAVVLASNYLVQFPIKYYGLDEILTYGAFSYPIAFLITDLANRSYGKVVARKIVYIGFFTGIVFTLFFLHCITFIHNTSMNARLGWALYFFFLFSDIICPSWLNFFFVVGIFIYFFR